MNPLWMVRESTGLFIKVRYLLLINAALNIALSIVFGLLWGVFGILLATSMSAILTRYWYEPKILYSDVFQRPVKEFWHNQLKYFLCGFIVLCACSLISLITGTTVIMIIIKGILILAVTVMVFVIFWYKTDEYIWLKEKFRSIINKFMRK
jgi:peptidoglycan biosynthesis protein MviN/MurJ (putative lipid II flippase)